MTPGQDLALQQVNRIAAERSGAISVTEVGTVAPYLQVSISVDCRRFPHEGGGIRLRERERFNIWIPPAFPFKPPTVRTPHKRWANVQHVQWTNYLCLYVATEVEWDPSDGMFGFMDRLLKWLTAASLGQLDEVGGPIHPPAVYTNADCPMIVPRVDAPAVDSKNWWGFAKLRSYGAHRRDIVGWCEIGEARVARDAGDVVSPAVLLADPMPWEYPTSLLDLLLNLARRGVSPSMLFTMMSLGQLLHDDEFVYVVVGTPMRGTVGGDPVQHLAVWRFRVESVAEFYETVHQDDDTEDIEAERDAKWHQLIDWTAKNNVKVEWCPVREARPEVTRPRDEHSPMADWAGKHVSIWGCGALGSNVAEHLARAGVQHFTLRDNASVAPGVLVRQNFEDADLGFSKVSALEARLRRIAPEVVVDIDTADLTADRGASWHDNADVLFDLSASPAVGQRLELSRRLHPSRSTVIGMTISHDATHGLVVVCTPQATGGVVDARRKAKVTAARSLPLQHLAEEFWPLDPTRTTSFLPEPGCSSPTFVGSNAEVAALAASMLLVATTATSQTQGMSAGFVSLPTATSDGATRFFSYPDDVVLADPLNGNQIRIAPAALAEMRAWARRTHRLSPQDETGGLLYGERDDALGVCWVTDVVGPPPDSQASPVLFRCGTEGVADADQVIRARSRDASRPVGMWHTHPNSWPVPSDTDHDGMTQIITDPDTPNPKQVLVILGGDPGSHSLGAYVYERHQANDLPRKLPLHELPNELRRDHRIGLALSGGGSRAVAFHLGVLRALHDRGVLDRVEVMSSVSGGSIIAAMWAYSSDSFAAFDARVTAMLRRGLTWRIARATVLTPRAALHAASLIGAVSTSVLRLGKRSVERLLSKSVDDRPPSFRRTVSLTSALQRVLATLIGDATVAQPSKDVHVVINACDLRTGTAFRFGSVESGSSRYGRLVDNNVAVAAAAAISAAYPVVLPAVPFDWEFEDRTGSRSVQRVVLTDGGVFDNLGTSCLEPGRSPAYSTNVHPVDYIISADAGRGALDSSAYPVFWGGRMKRSFESVYRKVQDGSKGAIFQHGRAGDLKGFVMPFLGQQDAALQITPPDLVTRDQVVGFPTNFSPMSQENINLLARRGEQLTRLLIEQHCPEIA